ncbi:MAG: tetratricopeptide repeat protein, partial [Pyrinomonadaceae bacterium]
MKFFSYFTRFATAWALICCFGLAASAQSTKPKPKPTPAKKTTATAQPGTTKPKTSTTKPKPTAAKPKTTALKPKTQKPKPVEEPKPDEKSEWDKTTAITDAGERISAVRKFLATFPVSERRNEGLALIVTAATEIGNASLAAGEPLKAAEYFKVAANDAPNPVPDQLFNDMLVKVPVNLYFRGARTEAFEIASLLEQKAAANADQLLSIATFYMSVENGAEARRVAEAAIKIAPTSSAAYQTLGLASRIDFRLDESATAYSKALELDPESLSARRGLAEMKRSTGKADEAVTLYREILAKDATNIPAQTGLVLALFDNGKVAEAEAEMAKSLEANPGNVILLAGAAYWYAVNKNGDKAVSSAQQAIASDPRFIWSHIALARGYLSQNNAAAAEKTLLAARRYGNFPTLEYEIASARITAGFYREAAEELSKSFNVKDGVIKTNLGGRVTRESKDFTELIGYERRASIFAPTAADSPENAAKLTALLEIKQQLDAAEPKDDTIAKAVDDFVRGDDKMRVHRQLFVASQLLDKRILLPKVLELTKTAVSGVDLGLEISAPSSAVMASELYEMRSLAITKGEYVNLPEVPRQTLSAIMRGRIEEIAGWALFQTDANDDAIIRLKRAVGVLPGDSAWWRSSTWRLASALAKAGKDSEALAWYIKSYKGATPNAFSYAVIEGLYKKVNGNTEGLELKIGAKPVSAALPDVVAQKVEPSPTPESKVEPSPSPAESP